ncbi:MAG: CheR family methyltransferase [Anaerolineae bacterium]
MTSHPYHPLVVQIGKLVEERTGLAVNAQFRGELEPLVRNLANGSLDTYLRQLRENSETSPIWQRLVYTLTIGETYFFRDQSHFRLLREHVLPTLALRRRSMSNPHVSLWSAGCATGEEPYSLAIALYEALPDLARWSIQLYGTDLNINALQAAQRGLYRKWSFRHTEDMLRSRHFIPHDGSWQIKPYIKAMVNFRHANLFAGPPQTPLDIIFCRNVLIYLNDAHIQQVEDIFFNALAPGGWLFLGQAEAIHFRRERWQTHIFPGTVAYQRPETTVKFLPQFHTQPTIEITPTAAPAQALPTYTDAVRAFHQDDRAKAERLLAELLTQEPHHAPAHTLLASIFASRRALPEAQTHLDHALHLDPLSADAHYLRGLLLLEENKKDDARKALDAALYCRPTHPLGLLFMGNLYAQSGELKRAHRLWEKARSAIASLPPDSHFSDLSDLTVSGFIALIGHNMHDTEAE